MKEARFLGPDSARGSGDTLMLDRAADLRQDPLYCLGVVLDPALLLGKQGAAAARLWVVYTLPGCNSSWKRRT